LYAGFAKDDGIGGREFLRKWLDAPSGADERATCYQGCA
jgi:hypothetical protein